MVRMKTLKLFIEGRFLDSYIYSGLLFLLGEDYVLSIYKWDNIVEKTTTLNNSHAFIDVLIDSTESIPQSDIKLFISLNDIKQSHLSSIRLNNWPSDINVYANILYISSEDGVIRYNLDYKNGTLTNEFLIYDGSSFSISPNSSNRLAIAAGKDGVLTFIPLSKYLNRNYVEEFISEPCMDVDWQSTVLLANTVNGVHRANYLPRPEMKEFNDKQIFFEKFKEFKQYRPTPISQEQVHLSWVGGDKVYYLNNDNSISIESIWKNNKVKKSKNYISSNIIKAKSAAFGAILETESDLYFINQSDAIKIHSEPVNWRVFPRAKNYSNHLHIISEDTIEIRIISEQNNILGFEPDRIDEKG